MTVDAGKTCRAHQLWIQGTTGVCLRLGCTALRGEAQVGHIDLIPMLLHTHQTVLWLDVSMDDILGVNILETMEKLVGKYQHRLEGELATTKIEKVLQTRSQKIEHHGLVFAFKQIIVNAWNTGTTRKRSVDIGFSFEEGGID